MTAERTNEYGRKYVDIYSLREAILPVAAENGMGVLQFVSARVIDDTHWEVCCVTRLVHVSGQWLESETRMPTLGFSPHAIGTAHTYNCRYALQNIFGVCKADEDDDGSSAMGEQNRDQTQSKTAPKREPPPKQQKREPAKQPPKQPEAAPAPESPKPAEPEKPREPQRTTEGNQERPPADDSPENAASKYPVALNALPRLATKQAFDNFRTRSREYLGKGLLTQAQFDDLMQKAESLAKEKLPREAIDELGDFFEKSLTEYKPAAEKEPEKKPEEPMAKADPSKWPEPIQGIYVEFIDRMGNTKTETEVNKCLYEFSQKTSHKELLREMGRCADVHRNYLLQK